MAQIGRRLHTWYSEDYPFSDHKIRLLLCYSHWAPLFLIKCLLVYCNGKSLWALDNLSLTGLLQQYVLHPPTFIRLTLTIRERCTLLYLYGWIMMNLKALKCSIFYLHIVVLSDGDHINVFYLVRQLVPTAYLVNWISLPISSHITYSLYAHAFRRCTISLDDWLTEFGSICMILALSSFSNDFSYTWLLRTLC